MVETLAYCIGRVAPLYNLVLVVVVIFLFLKLFKTKTKKKKLTPWKYLFAAVLVYVGEEIVTVMDMAGIIHAPKLVFPFFEMVIITLFIYVLLFQRENLKK